MANKPFYTIDQIITKAIALLSEHEYIRNPIVFNNTGSPIRITQFRDHAGFNVNNTGLTLSIYPYTYTTSDLTVRTENAAITYRPHHLGDREHPSAFQEGTMNLIVELSTTGSTTSSTHLDATRPVSFVQSDYERALRRWIEVLACILLTKPLATVGGYVKNSRVNHGHFKTTSKDANKGSAMVFHTASLTWSLDYWPVRDLRAIPKNPVILGPDGLTMPGYVENGPEGSTTLTRGWKFVGIRTSDLMNIYWDGDRGDLVTMSGYVLRTTPKGQAVQWNPELERFERRGVTPLVALTPTELQDPTNGNKPWIETGLKIVGVVKVPATESAPASSTYDLFVVKATGALRKADGTVVTQLPDTSALSYDLATKRLVLIPVDGFSHDLLIDFTDPARIIFNTRDSLGKLAPEQSKIQGAS